MCEYALLQTNTTHSSHYADIRDQPARKLFKSTIQPTSSLHNFLPLFRTIPLSLDYELPQTFLVSPSEPKIPILFFPMSSPTIRLHCFIVFTACFLSVCVSIYSVVYISIQPMAITSNKHINHVKYAEGNKHLAWHFFIITEALRHGRNCFGIRAVYIWMRNCYCFQCFDTVCVKALWFQQFSKVSFEICGVPLSNRHKSGTWL